MLPLGSSEIDKTDLGCVAGGIRERSGGGAAISPRTAKPRVNFNTTLHQSSQRFSTRVHGFDTKTKALARKITPAT